MEWAKLLDEARAILEGVRNFHTAEWTAIFCAILAFTFFIQTLFIMRANRVARDAARAAHRIGDSLQATERAYVAEQISDRYQLRTTLSALAASDSKDLANGDIVAEIQFKNFGKTPATLKVWAGGLYADVAVRRAESDPKLFPLRILSPQEETGPQIISMAQGHSLLDGQAKKIEAGTLHLWASGFVEYEDIFGKSSKREFIWRYDYPQTCFVPHYFNIVEEDG